MRNFFIWLTGILFSVIVGGLIGDKIGPDPGGGFWGVIAGAMAFTCARLVLTRQRPLGM
jgi:hypothetical protein